MKLFLRIIFIVSICIGIALDLHAAHWYENANQFYNDAIPQILKIAQNEGFSNIVLLSEINKSDYHLSTPCNKGLSKYLIQKIKLNHKNINVFYWDGNIKNEISFLSLLVSSQGNWYKRILKGKVKIDTIPKQSLKLQLVIHKITINDKENKYVSTFGINRENGRTIFKKTQYEGKTYQTRLFLMKKTYISNIFFLILLCLFSIFIIKFLWTLKNYIFHQAFLPDINTILGGLIIFIGLFIPILMNYLISYEKQEAFYEQNTLIFIVDENSEIVLAPEKTKNKTTALDLVYIMKAIYKNIVNYYYTKDNSEKQNLNSLLQWLRYRLSVVLFGKDKYQLNTDYGYYIHKVSGGETKQSTSKTIKISKNDDVNNPFLLIIASIENHDLWYRKKNLL